MFTGDRQNTNGNYVVKWVTKKTEYKKRGVRWRWHFPTALGEKHLCAMMFACTRTYQNQKKMATNEGEKRLIFYLWVENELFVQERVSFRDIGTLLVPIYKHPLRQTIDTHV